MEHIKNEINNLEICPHNEFPNPPHYNFIGDGRRIERTSQ
jgi:hypothetical protein